MLLQALPPSCERALDVGCGTGIFARRLASHCAHVDALDHDPDSVRQAQEHCAGMRNVRVLVADFLGWAEEHPYDFVSMIAVLHHLPFAAALEKTASVLRPGGVLVALGLHRPISVFHAAAASVVAWPVSCYFRLTRGYAPVDSPVVEPAMTLPEIRTQAAAILPGVRITRCVLWRYFLTWTKPR